MKWSKGKLTIPKYMDKGTVDVDGYICGPLGVYTIGGKSWAVMHIPSGKLINILSHKMVKVAKHRAEYMMTNADMTKQTPEEMSDSVAKLVQLCYDAVEKYPK